MPEPDTPSSSTDTPLVTVVIPTYGRPQYLAEAIDSILRQDVADVEVVVVDDGSPEPAAVEPHPRVHLIRQEEHTPRLTHALNLLFRLWHPLFY